MKDSSVIPCVGRIVVKILIPYFCIKKFNSFMLGALFYLKLMSFHIKAQKDNIIWTSILLAFLNSMIECHQSILRQLILINVFNEKRKYLLTCLWRLSYLWDRKNDVMSFDVPYTKRKMSVLRLMILILCLIIHMVTTDHFSDERETG